jgi:2-polyprenyl-3-methyl-5-hydroxy-6-metoxy-1,4-benzoquinol methylase
MKNQPPSPPDLGQPLSEKELCPEQLLAGQEAAFQRDVERLRARRAEFVSVSCPACQGEDLSPELRKFGFDYVTCRRCRTMFMNPRPSPEIMAAYYADSENYRYWAQYIFPASEASRREKIHRPWLERVLSYCRRYQVPTEVLVEVGAGFGTFCQLARECGRFRRVIAVEPTPEMAEACRRRGVEVLARRIEEVDPGALPPVDVLVSFEVIEHLFSPRRFLAGCARLLRPGGILVLSCPNGQGFDISLLREKSLAIDPEHVNFFNPASLTLLLESQGFQVLQVSTPGRLDAEFVREAALKGDYRLPDPFLRRVLLEEWERLGWPFQQFLAQHQLSSHMWAVARRPPRA